MRKKIYENMYMLTIVSIVVTTIFLILVFYNILNSQMENEVKTEATFFEKSLNYYDDNLKFINSLELTKDDTRITIIAEDGKILYDSYKDLDAMENHLDRPEVIEAFNAGSSNYTRYSTTLGEKTYYYAVRLDDGTVLRLSKVKNSVVAVIMQALPMIILIMVFAFLLCNYAAKKLTQRIIMPINNMDLSKDQTVYYEELSPFIKMINTQKQQINAQFQELTNEANTIKIITENMQEGLLLLDKKGKIVSVNKSALDFFEGNFDDYTGRNTLELVRNLELSENIKKALLGKSGDIVLNLNSKTFHIFLNPVFNEGEVNGAVILFFDYTEKYNVEKMRREFSANVSHELKTPLTTIMGYSEMINNDMVKADDIKNFSGKISNEAKRLISLIENIIMLSQLDENTGMVQFENFKLEDLAVEVAEQLKPVAVKNNVEIFVSNNGVSINANRQMMYEMLFNLMDNAIKYNKINGKVYVDVAEEMGKVKIEITDTGIGISQLHQSRVFERFYRVDKSRSKKTGGTGLGLSIVKHIVEYHGGSVQIASSEGSGTSIKIII